MNQKYNVSKSQQSPYSKGIDIVTIYASPIKAGQGGMIWSIIKGNRRQIGRGIKNARQNGWTKF